MGNINFKTKSGSEYAVEYSGSLNITEDCVSGVATKILRENKEVDNLKSPFTTHDQAIPFIFHNGVFTAAPENILEDIDATFLQTSPLIGSLEIKDDTGKKTNIDLPPFDPQTRSISRNKFVMNEVEFLASLHISNQKDSLNDRFEPSEPEL